LRGFNEVGALNSESGAIFTQGSGTLELEVEGNRLTAAGPSRSRFAKNAQAQKRAALNGPQRTRGTCERPARRRITDPAQVKYGHHHREISTMIRTIFASLLLSVSLVALSKTTLLEHIPLQWRPTSALRLGTAQMTALPVTIATFTDGRDNRGVIGENTEDDEPKLVTTSDDVGAFVSTHIRQLFNQAGIKTVDSNGVVTIQGEVKRFFAREGDTYRSEVVINLTVIDQDGKTLWKGLASGEATRFGRSYKVENYYEALSDAVVNTVSSMLQAADFQRAISGHAIGES